MARPLKHGLDYFPLDCNFDDKVRALVGKFKARGLGIFTRLLQTIYSSGYYIETTTEMVEDMGIELNVDEEIILKVIDFACRRKIFCLPLYKKHKVLTSHGIQKRFLEATRKRQGFNKINIYGVNDSNNPINDGNNPVNDIQSTQRKGKESKGKESKGNKSKGNKSKEVKDKKTLYLEKVLLTETEYNNLIKPWGRLKKFYNINERELAIETLDNYLRSSNKKYDSHYAVLQGWVYDRIKPVKQQTSFDKMMEDRGNIRSAQNANG